MLESRVRPKHPKKEVNDALDYADQQGFDVGRTVSGHRWGRITCTCGSVCLDTRAIVGCTHLLNHQLRVAIAMEHLLHRSFEELREANRERQ